MILVTGASGGIGQVIAKTVALAGASVAVGFHQDEKRALEAQSFCGEESILVQGDVSHPVECRRIVETVIEKYGRIDILVNNAAIGMRDSLEMPYEAWLSQWNATLNANLMSAVNMTFCCAPHMRRHRRGKIINISSRSAFRGETEHMAYAASKAAMVNFTRCVARALAKGQHTGICRCPGVH